MAFAAVVWLAATAAFVGIPVGVFLRAYRRQAAAHPGAAAILRRRFFVPRRRSDPLAPDLIGRKVWIELWDPTSRQVTAVGEVRAIEQRELVIGGIAKGVEHCFTFRPRRESRDFAAGIGAATGVAMAGKEVSSALVIFLTAKEGG